MSENSIEPDSKNDRGLGEMLRDVRERKGWSQQRLADSLGTTQQTVGRWESGHTPQFRFRDVLADTVDLTRSELDALLEHDATRGNVVRLRSQEDDALSAPSARSVVLRRLEMLKGKEMSQSEASLLNRLLDDAE